MSFHRPCVTCVKRRRRHAGRGRREPFLQLCYHHRIDPAVARTRSAKLNTRTARRLAKGGVPTAAGGIPSCAAGLRMAIARARPTSHLGPALSQSRPIPHTESTRHPDPLPQCNARPTRPDARAFAHAGAWGPLQAPRDHRALPRLDRSLRGPIRAPHLRPPRVRPPRAGRRARGRSFRRSPAVGRCLAERITTGRRQLMDLRPSAQPLRREPALPGCAHIRQRAPRHFTIMGRPRVRAAACNALPSHPDGVLRL